MAKIVDEYTIAIDDTTGFKVIHLTFKLDNGTSEGPYELVPAYAHNLSDELCTASAQATKKVGHGLSENIPNG